MKSKSLIGILVIAILFISGCSFSSTTTAVSNSSEDDDYMGKATDSQITQKDIFTPFNLDAPEVNYLLSSNQITTPRDVLREISFSGGGAWGFLTSCKGLDQSKNILFLASDNNESLIWKDTASNLACGWEPGEKVTYSITSPDNTTTILDKITADKFGSVLFSYPIELNTKPGQYQLTLEGNSGTISQTIQVVINNKAQAFYDWDNDLVYLYGFSPNENVRLVAYKRVTSKKYEQDFLMEGLIGELWDIKNYNVDNSGQLIINLSNKPSSDLGFVIVGDKSGDVRLFNGDTLGVFQSIISSIGVRASRPTIQEYSQTITIWDYLEYQENYQPGEHFYTINIARNKDLIWGFNWCAMDNETLDQILGPMDVKFLVDGIEIDKFNQMQKDIVQTSEGWICTRWRTILSDWDDNPTHTFMISYDLSSDIYNGETAYPAGNYKQIIKIQIK